MNPNLCPQEATLLAALANGSMSDELTAHLHECAACEDAKLVWTYLQQCAAADQQSEIAPAEGIWWKAQIEKRRLGARRSVAMIEAMQKIAFAIAAILLVALAAWQAPILLQMRPVLLGGSAAVLMLFVLSVAVVLRLGRDSGRPSLPHGT